MCLSKLSRLEPCVEMHMRATNWIFHAKVGKPSQKSNLQVMGTLKELVVHSRKVLGRLAVVSLWWKMHALGGKVVLSLCHPQHSEHPTLAVSMEDWQWKLSAKLINFTHLLYFSNFIGLCLFHTLCFNKLRT